jgi:hypothetical protein
MKRTGKRVATTTLVSALALLNFCITSAWAEPASHHGSMHTVETLTLEHLKNGSYQIPDSACGFKVVKLHEGKGEADGVKVVFGRAVFGKLTNKQESGAAIHMAYHDEMFGWMQQMVFVVARGDKLLQIAELGLDEREQVKNIEMRDGDVLIETSIPEGNSGKVYKKCTKAQLVETKNGCELTASQFNWYTTEGDQGDAPAKLAVLRK